MHTEDQRKYTLLTIDYRNKRNVAQKLLFTIASLILVYCTMKQLMTKLETFFLAMTLVDDCKFKRGLRIRSKPANSTARGKFPI